MITAVAAMLMTAATFAQANNGPNDGPPPSTNGRTMMQPQKRAPMTPEQRAKKETDEINSMVALGSSYDKVLSVNTDYHTKRDGLRGTEKRGEMTDDQKAQMKALNDAHRKDLETAMGSDLFAKWKAAEKAKREERKEMRQQQSAPAPAGK